MTTVMRIIITLQFCAQILRGISRSLSPLALGHRSFQGEYTCGVWKEIKFRLVDLYKILHTAMFI